VSYRIQHADDIDADLANTMIPQTFRFDLPDGILSGFMSVTSPILS
jgi:hypothetical protein